MRILHYVPKNLYTLFQDVCRPILADIERAAQSGNNVQLTRYILEFMSVPAHTLVVKRGGRRKEGHIALAMRSTIEARTAPPTQIQSTGQPRHAQSLDHLETSEAKIQAQNVKRAVGLTLSNHVSRAARAIYQDNLPEITPDIEAKLVDLHPPATLTPLPNLPTNASFTVVLPDERFAKLWRERIANGAAPAVSGFTGDHGLPLLEDQHCIRGLALLIQLIRNAQLPEDLREHLLGSPIIPTAKSTGGIRPITIAETLYKMAATHALDDVQNEAIRILGCDQFALAPGGPESACLTLKAALETQTGASTDIRNAFNSLDRGMMMRQLFSHPTLSPIWRLAHWVYKQPIRLHLYDNNKDLIRFIDSSCGSLQGEPFSSLLYCLTVKPLIEEAKAAGGTEVKVVSITDDLTFVGPRDGVSVMRAVQAYREGTARYNLDFQQTKSYFIALHGNPLAPEVEEYSREHQMRIETQCCVIGGTPMGSDRRRVQQEALRIARDSQKIFHSLQHECMTAPVADRLLRTSGIPRLHYLSRVGLLGEYREAMEYFDAEVERAAKELASIESDREISRQQAIPLKQGGFAFKKYTDNVSLFASIGAVAASSAHIDRVCLEGLPPVFAQSIHDTIQLVRQRIDEDTAGKYLPPPDLQPNQIAKWYAMDERRSLSAGLQKR